MGTPIPIRNYAHTSLYYILLFKKNVQKISFHRVPQPTNSGNSKIKKFARGKTSSTSTKLVKMKSSTNFDNFYKAAIDDKFDSTRQLRRSYRSLQLRLTLTTLKLLSR